MFLDHLSKHCCMGNVMNFLAPFTKVVIYLLPFLVYPALLCSCEGYTPNTCVQFDNHIFPFHCFVNLSCDLYDISSNISLLM